MSNPMQSVVGQVESDASDQLARATVVQVTDNGLYVRRDGSTTIEGPYVTLTQGSLTLNFFVDNEVLMLRVSTGYVIIANMSAPPAPPVAYLSDVANNVVNTLPVDGTIHDRETSIGSGVLDIYLDAPVGLWMFVCTSDFRPYDFSFAARSCYWKMYLRKVGTPDTIVDQMGISHGYGEITVVMHTFVNVTAPARYKVSASLSVPAPINPADMIPWDGATIRALKLNAV